MPAILDVGCGTGINLLEAARWFAPARLLCGIDLSQGMIDVARRKAETRGVPAQFTVGDAERLPYPDGTFDLVICNSVLHWFRDRRAAVREMGRVLRPGGQVAIICAASPGWTEWFDLMDYLVQSLSPSPVPRSLPQLPTVPEVSGLLTESGFRIGHLQHPVNVQRVTDYPGFVRLMSTVAPGWAGDLPPETQSLMEQLAVSLMWRGWPHGFPVTWAAIEAIGIKAVP